MVRSLSGGPCGRAYLHAAQNPSAPAGTAGLADSRDRWTGRIASRAFALESPLVEAEKQLLSRVSLKLSSSDYDVQPGLAATSYLTAGLSASRSIQASLDAAGKRISGGAVLDLPCGYGRVLRFLKAMFPDSTSVGLGYRPGNAGILRAGIWQPGAPSEFSPQCEESVPAFEV